MQLADLVWIGQSIANYGEACSVPWRVVFREAKLIKALSRCRTIDANDLIDDDAHAAAAVARHVSMAEV